MPEKQEKWEDVKFEQAMDIAGFGKFSMFIIFLSGLTVCISLLSSVDVSFLMPAAECDLELTSQDKGLLSSAYFFGVIATSHLSGFLADTLGRRYVLVRGLALNVFTYILGSIAPNFWTFLACKFASGILTCPCMIATFPFLGEYIPSSKRTQGLLITTSLSTLALIYSAMVGWLTLQSDWVIDLWFVKFTPWRLFYLLCGVPSAFCALLFYLTPESPKFLLTRGKKGDTMKILEKVHRINSGKRPQTYPVMSITVDTDDIVPPIQKEKGAASILKHICNQTMPLLKPPYFKNLFLCIIIIFISFLCLNSILLWLPEVTNRMAQYKEINEGKFHLCSMMSRNSSTISMTADTNNTVVCDATINPAVFVPNLLVAVVQPAIMLCASFVVPLVDRRAVIMVVMIACSGMGFLVTSIADASLIIMLFGGISILISVSYNVVTDIIIELFPTYIRAMAVSLTIIFGRVGSVVGSQLFSQLIDCHCELLFKLISGFMLCCAAVPFCLKLKEKKTEQPPTPS